MFESILSHIKKIKSLTTSKTFEFVFDKKQMQDFIIYLNTEEQLFKGRIDSEGKKLPLYSRATEILSNGDKRAGTPFTLKDTGEFYESFRVILDKDKLTIIANTIKVNEEGFEKNLLDYSENIIGLTDESLEKVIQKARQITIDYVRKQIL